MKLRTKKRGYHQNGLKQDGITRSMDLCPHCYAFDCDPFAMSPAFRSKISYRLSHGLCPACGKPAEFCSCKSTMDPDKVKRVRTHNNKKLRRAIAAAERSV